MVAFVVKIFTFLLIIALITPSVVTEKLSMKNRNGNDAHTPTTKNSTEDHSQIVSGIRRVFMNSLTNPDKDCYKKFFVNKELPKGLRSGFREQNARFICQEVNQETYYGTMFDETTGIAVFSAYTLTPDNVKFQDRNPSKWTQTEGIHKQGNDYMYPSIPYHRGHLVPKKTYSSTPESVRSTYTYTNAVPQRPAFNSGQWAQFEKRIRKYAEKCTNQLKGKLYLLTGTSFAHFVPADQVNQPTIEYPTIHKLPGNPVQSHFILIPNSMWTAGCCVAQDDKDTSNFAVIGNNVEDPNTMHTQQITVNLLQSFLLTEIKHYGMGGPLVSLFPGKELCSNEHRDVTLPLARRFTK